MTGNYIVDEITQLHITGNIIPESWYKAITRPNGKPYLNAIIILSELVYWYRAVEVRDENTGMLVGYRKKFREDLLRRSYQELADKFGLSKRDVINAIVALEKQGLVRRVFRTVVFCSGTNKTVRNNVLYIELCAAKLRRITYPGAYQPLECEQENTGCKQVSENETDDREGFTDIREEVKNDIKKDTTLPSHRKKREAPTENGGRLPLKTGGGSHSKTGEAPTQNGGTYKEITKEITSIYNTNPISSYPVVKDTGNEEIKNSNAPPRSWSNYPLGNQSDYYPRVQNKFREQIDYEALSCDLQFSSDIQRLDELVDIAVELLCLADDASVWAAGQSRPAGLVKARLCKLTMEHMRYILRCLEVQGSQIRSIKNYIIAALFNAPVTMQAHIQNLFAVNEPGGFIKARQEGVSMNERPYVPCEFAS